MSTSLVKQDRPAPRPTDEPPAFQARDASLSLQTYLERLTLPPLYNLPVTLTDFIGRQAELATLRDLLSQQRLVSLVGLGGVGKTRLTLQLASERRAAFADGVCFVPLLAVNSPDLVVSALADAIQLPVYQDTDLKGHLLNYLRDKHLLLVLDNLEHLLPATNLVIEIMEHAPHVKILITSRERLNLYGEWVFEVGGLGLPEGEGAPEIEASDAARLFLHSARRVCPNFSPGVADRRQVARICRLVGGLPLALELAGAWVKVLNCQAIADEIERDLGFLNTSWANMPERHRSLQAVFQHSWDLLDQREQQVFEQLAVFVGGFSKEAAEQVANASLSALAALVDHSFLSWNPERKRYALHPLLQRYAEEQLDKEAGDLVRDLHCAYFMSFLREREESIRGKQPFQILQEIAGEIRNIQVAWRWAVAHGKIDCLENGLETLYQFYDTRSRFQEGVDLFTWAAQKWSTEQSETSEKANHVIRKLAARQGAFLVNLGSLKEAQHALQRNLEMSRVMGDLVETVFCLSHLATIATREGKLDLAAELAGEGLSLARSGKLRRAEAENLYLLETVYHHQGDFTQEEQYFRQSLQIQHELSDYRGEGTVLCASGLRCLDVEDYDGAARHYRRALDIFSELGDLYQVERCLDNLGNVSHGQGEYAKAKTFHEQALILARQIGDRNGEGRFLYNLGESLLDLGAYEQAKGYFEQALLILRETGSQRGESFALEGLGHLACNLGSYEVACSHYQQALALAREVSNPSQQGEALAGLGHALLGLSQLDEAASAYQEALILRRELGQRTPTVECLTGLARVALALGNLGQAQAYVDEILREMQEQKPGCEFDLFQVYLTCYQVLRASHDPRAVDTIYTAYYLLQEQAATIHDEDLRHSFLENIKTHREITKEFATLATVASDKEDPVAMNKPAPELVEPLTPQELQVLHLLAAGLTNRQIAERLVITVGTVKFHAHSLYGKLGVESRTQAVARARALNLI